MGKRLEQTFLQRKIQMATKYMERCSTSLAIGEMKIKTTEYFIVDNGNTKVMNRKEILLTKDFIINCKKPDNQQ